MARIAVLSEDLINKIAAGEVVERPASVVKELCENALDAQARTVRVFLSEGGLSLISVVDDGVGMGREDAVLAFQRHATSKLHDLDGLFRICTKGFRGEAIPAIASVSRMTLTTAESGAAVGTQISVDGGGNLQVRDAAPRVGTQVSVMDLFYNTPARRKFMRRAQTEQSHCVDVVIRLALAHPEVAFSVEHEGRLAWSSPSTGDVRERIAAALGEEVHAHLLEVQERRLGLTVRGHIASPVFTLSNARGIYTFVNARYIRDRGLNAAIQRGFGDGLAPGRQPVAVLFLEMEPGDVDVNVHPQKLEVRFGDSRGVYEAVFAAVRSGARAPSISAEGQTTFPADDARYAFAVDQFLARAREGAPLSAEPVHTSVPMIGEQAAWLNDARPEGFFAGLRFIGMLAQRFWLLEGTGGSLLILDPHAAFERIHASLFWRALLKDAPSAQHSLFSQTVELGDTQVATLELHRAALADIGLEVERFGDRAVAVRRVPAGLEGADCQSLLWELSSALPREAGAPEAYGPAIRVLACHAATLAPRAPAGDELRAVLRRLDEADLSLETLHPGVIVRDIPLYELDRDGAGKLTL